MLYRVANQDWWYGTTSGSSLIGLVAKESRLLSHGRVRTLSYVNQFSSNSNSFSHARDPPSETSTFVPTLDPICSSNLIPASASASFHSSSLCSYLVSSSLRALAFQKPFESCQNLLLNLPPRHIVNPLHLPAPNNGVPRHSIK